VTIDGPSASGKSTVASRVATALGRIYVDSGSLYRGITWKAVNEGIDPDNSDALSTFLDSLHMEFYLNDDAVRFTIDGVDPHDELRSAAVRETVSRFAEAPQVREHIVKSLRGLVSFGDLVIEGRDIGSEVFPGAKFKFYLDASPEERASRRQGDLTGRGEETDTRAVLESLERRDKRDSSRATAPLKVPEGAMVLDTTGKTIESVVKVILDEVSQS
jgi:cytidylate kinase